MRKKNNFIGMCILLVSSIAISNFMLVQSYQNTNQLSFNENISIAAYFLEHPEMDGLTSESAYIFQDLHFIDNIEPNDKTGGQYDYIQLSIINTDRFINITNCIFQMHPKTSYNDLNCIALYLQNCTNIIISNCRFEFFRELEIQGCNNISIIGCEFLNGFLRDMNSNNTQIESNLFHSDISKISDMFAYSQVRMHGGCGFGSNVNTTVFNNTLIEVSMLALGGNMENTTVKNNTLIRAQFEVINSLTKIPNIDTTNTVNGRFAYFFFEENDLTEANFTNAGQVYLSNCQDCLIGNIISSYIKDGIKFQNCNNITLYNSTIIYPIYSGIKVDGSSNVLLENNSIFGWTYDWQKYTTSQAGNQNPLANIGIWIRGYTEGQKSNNINITRNIICGYQYGMFIFTADNGYQAIDNVTVWDNYYAYNGINGYVSYPAWYTEHKWVTFNNETTGNYWDDYEAPRIADSTNLPSGSSSSLPYASVDIWEGSYNVNGILDQKPLKTYDHAVVLFDLVVLYPWASDDFNIWIIIGIVGGCIGLAGILIYLKKNKLN